MASRWTIWSATTTSTTRPTARTTRTAPTTTTPGIWAPKARPTIPQINRAREVQKRNLLATLFLSQGVPMLCGGDEIGRTQHGNNNAYCQDNEISWYDWNLDERQQRLLEFTRQLIALRRAHPNLRRRKFFQDREVRHSSLKDIAWYGDNGEEMTQEQWNAGWMRSIALMYNGNTLGEVDEMGQSDHG